MSRSFSRRSLALCVATATSLSVAVPASSAAIVNNVIEHSAADASLKLTPVGTYESEVYAESAAEIVAFHPASKRILTVNAHAGQIDILDASDPAKPTLIGSISAGKGKEINSVAVRPDGLAVAAVQQADKTEDGDALFFNAAAADLDTAELGRVMVGALPDNVHLTADGGYALVANEGEPSNELNAEGTDYVTDPEGSVSVIKLPEAVEAPTQADARIAGFTAFDGQPLPEGVRVFGPSGHDSKPSIDFEPEYITSQDGKAFVTLQEANAIGVIDIESATVEKILPAHIADHSQVPLDPSNKDDAAELRTIPVKGLSMPDSIGAFTAGGQTYFATANEGDAREWGIKEKDGGSGVYTDEVELKDLVEEGKVCEGALGDVDLDKLADKKEAGNLKLSNASGWNEEKGCFDELYAYGSRSFSIYDSEGNIVFDSGAEFEKITAELNEPGIFHHNADNEEATFDDRSDNKGPEPEALTIGTVGERTYAFIGAERVGGIFVYDVTDPTNASFVTYVNNRDFSTDEFAAAGDLGPEGFAFVDKADSPNGEHLLIVGNEVSGTTTAYNVEDLLNADEDNEDDADDHGENKSSQSSHSSTATIAVGSIIGVIAAVAAAVGLLNTPGVRETVLSFAPAPLREQLGKFL
ncbi:choice-of-anchor I family protein [Corynebacterium aurimucosum]|uniref:Alkaline phosphatase n=1 Tax=Corynebacterium aurimucosum (strain ATCC 700975 / DSM 44827 / CIP 107346 / CN-1) TaxID=548476 RepID=C3PHC8_CORA7|nr:choice-of-anchor I family protein [Corynebacterium aurimucosum]ACP33232.1 alkaline phosphatase [Corynebacterium aurimucosum ATCC 700975]QQU92646.1 choice-of-anchor I family protein [Corynebacterium aurimucosum]